MSEITVAEFKAFARIIHSADDAMIQALIDTAEDECRRFLNRGQLATLPLDYPPVYDSSSSEIPEDEPSSDDPIAPSVRMAVYWLTQARYEGKDADEVQKIRGVAETLLFPYRTQLGA